MTTTRYIGVDRKKQRQVARERSKKGLPISLSHFLTLIEDEDPKVRFVELPSWIDGHGFNTDGMYDLRWWKDTLQKVKQSAEAA